MTPARYFIFLAPVLSLCACMPADRPSPASAAVALPTAWRDTSSGNGTVDPAWWQAFGDPALTRLIEAALVRNTDVLTATARVEEVAADIRLARSALLPSLDAVGAAQRSRSLGTTGTTTSTALQPEIQLSWQVDMFGRLSRLTAAARQQYVASQADRDAVALSVAAQTAQAYVGLLALDAQLAVSRETVKSRAEALRLATDQAQVGYTSQFELTQAQAEYEAVSQAIPQFEQAIRAQENALRLLTGEMPGPVTRSDGALLAATPPTVPATLPADLLRRRPDIVSAEAMVAAADASLAARRAQFLPQVALSASLGQLFVNGLDYDPVTIWDVGASALAPLFAGGRLRAQVDAATAQRDQAAFAYRGAALKAFGEVETGLSGVSRFAEQIERLHNRRQILIRSVAMARDRYRGGYASYLELLDAQRNLYSTELDAIGVRQDQLDNIITLYRALGGGWSAPSPATAKAEP
ncbi:MAG: type secretion outer membrane protein [Novosphingobium lindaniclasticum]|uniref:efflux transporter outer membrane subunit n=1 Tax=Novosphingobium lindaniclasticum TaxID=1329895 RepID=UPI002409AB7B|nr:efflux transporter outer membrane subunit [Novosphingobium lindaniclasticum]MDF2640723.1 type secretion outer membrane protein [Novosphingobium lindaniclasticum]